jgi:hypothetical protein
LYAKNKPILYPINLKTKNINLLHVYLKCEYTDTMTLGKDICYYFQTYHLFDLLFNWDWFFSLKKKQHSFFKFIYSNFDKITIGYLQLFIHF